MSRFRRINLCNDCRGATAVEFALVCAPFIIFISAVMGVGLHFYQQQALDYATQAAVRQVQIGYISAGSGQAEFLTRVFCPAFEPLQTCTNVFVDLHPVTDYQQLVRAGVPDAPDSTATTGFVFCPGKPGQLMYAHIVYTTSTVIGTLLGSMTNGYDTFIANAAFANENPTGLPVSPANGC